MQQWRDEVLKYFTEPVPVFTIIADPDGLLLDVRIQQALSDQAIEVIDYTESVSFRYLYESRYRDAFTKASLRVIVRIQDPSYEVLPFDILSRGRKLNISLGNLFPALSAHVLKQLAKDDLDTIAEAYEQYSGTNSDTETAEFVLETVFNIHTDTIHTSIDLLKLLITLHYNGQQLPENLAGFLCIRWGQELQLKELPLKELLCSETFFFQYLQTEWNALIDDLIRRSQFVNEAVSDVYPEEKYFLTDKSIRLLLDNLFAEGKLMPVAISGSNHLPEWVGFGIEVDQVEQIRVRVVERIFYLSEKLNENMTYKDWTHIAIAFGELKEKALIVREGRDHEINMNLAQLQMQIDRLFSKWILEHYNHLSNLPYLPNPVMVHHIPHYLANKRQENKIALVVLDGMSVVQWMQIRDALKANFIFEQQGVFAWLPTITSVSRQAIFCGERPVYYSASINTTSKEERHWQLFWENHGIMKPYVDYCRIANYPSSYQAAIGAVSPNNKVRAIVIDLIDQLVHAAIQGNRGLYEEMKIWLETGFLQEMITSLFNEGYQVYLTSDHGNRECVGNGRISEGILAHSRGERVRVYNSKTLRDQAAATHGGIPWDSPSLPVNMHSLLAPVNGAFVSAGKKIISHGSMALEEVIVPFIKINPKERQEQQYEQSSWI